MRRGTSRLADAFPALTAEVADLPLLRAPLLGDTQFPKPSDRDKIKRTNLPLTGCHVA
jgi:hypothetical protein